MFIKIIARYGVVILFSVIVAGCSALDFEESAGGSGSAGYQTSECSWNRSSCMYEGPYEPGERAYAEQEARRLNQAALDRLRRSSGRL